MAAITAIVIVGAGIALIIGGVVKLLRWMF